jgi:hypothetical protein
LIYSGVPIKQIGGRNRLANKGKVAGKSSIICLDIIQINNIEVEMHRGLTDLIRVYDLAERSINDTEFL